VVARKKSSDHDNHKIMKNFNFGALFLKAKDYAAGKNWQNNNNL
jgi:hypothetical protein